MNGSSTKKDDLDNNKLLLVLLILFLVILLLLIGLIVISIFLMGKNDSPLMGGHLKLRSFMEEDDEDETCLPPSCTATCYKSDADQRIGPNFYFDEPFDILKTRLKINLTILRDVQIGINLVSPINRNLWHVTVRLYENHFVLNYQATENSWNANRTVIGNVTDIHVDELFTLYAAPILEPKNDLYGFQFDVQPLNKTKVTLGEIASPLKPGEQNGTGYHIAAYGPVLLSAYCTEVPQ